MPRHSLAALAALTLALVPAPRAWGLEADTIAPAVQPLPTIVVPIGPTSGVPAQSCKDALSQAVTLRAVRPKLAAAPPVRPPQDWPSRSEEVDDDGVTGRPRVVVSAASLARSGLPGQDPSALPLQLLEGRPQDLAAVGDVLRKAAGGGHVRMTVFGASHTSGDFWTGRLRRVLQSRYGDLGHGFILPAALYKGYRAQDLNLCRTDGWRADWVGRRSGRDDGLYGLGASVSSGDPADLGWIETTVDNEQGRALSLVQIFTLGEPAAGTLQVQVDDAPVEELVSGTADVKILRHRIEVADGPHRVTLRPKGDGEVRIFGVSTERQGPGVIVDAIGIRGRTARTWLRWDAELSTRMLASLAPDLFVLAYGTNEANDLALTPEDYRRDLRAVLALARVAAPSAACVLVGPSDRGKKVSRDTYVVWDRTAPVAQIQREVAPEFGCVFWDWQQATGGPGSQIAWSLMSPRLAARDQIHFSAAGYEWSADRFLMAMEQAALQSGGLDGPHLDPPPSVAQTQPEGLAVPAP